MKVIDLLNKIANGEEVPSPIYHNNLYYDFEDGDYFNQKTRNWLFNDSDIETILNDEVEIIEEDKKIEPINMFDYFTGYDFGVSNELLRHLERNFETINEKVNEIIDFVNKE